MSLYKYLVTYTTTSATFTSEVFPLGVDQLTLNDVKEDGQIFSRKELSGKLVFTNRGAIQDYNLFYSLDSNILDKCGEISLEIQRSCDNGTTWDNYWNGYFSTTDGEFNIDKCIFTVDVKPDDEYRCYIEGFENEINLATVQAEDDGSLFIPVTDYEFWTCRDTYGNCNAGLPTPASQWRIFQSDTIDGVETNIYYRTSKLVACQGGVAVPPSGSGWYQDTSYNGGDCSVNGLSKWVKLPAVVSIPNPDVVAGNCNGSNPSPPPHAITLDVTITNTPTPKVIRCYADIPIYGGVSSPPINYQTPFCYYEVDDNPNSTFNWDDADGQLTIVSGQGTNKILAYQNDSLGYNPMVVRLTETTSCGDVNVSTFNVNTTSVGMSSNISSMIKGQQRVCENQTGIVYRILDIPTEGGDADVSVPIWVVTGATLVSGQNTNEIIVTALTANFTVAVSFSVGIYIFGGGDYAVNYSGSISVVTTNVTKGNTITGVTSICPNDSGMLYELPVRDSTVSWTVVGGSVTSFSGTHGVYITWDGVGAGSITALETISCGCNWVLIDGDLANDESSCAYGLPYYWCADGTLYDIINNSSLESVVNYVKDAICTGLDIKSDFFEWDAPGDTIGYVAGINYVTGLSNQLRYLGLVPLRAMIYSFTGNTDFLNSTADEVVSWKDIETIFREVFNAYWFIDTNGNLRVEHISWFNRYVTYDLTDAYYSKYSSGKNIYSYDKSKAPKYERFKWQIATNTDFIGAEIRYSGNCIETDPKTNVKIYSLDFITTDLTELASLGEQMGRKGFALICYNSSNTVATEQGKISGLFPPNAHLSWANLHYNYFRHARVLYNGNMNLIETAFLSTIKYKTQTDVSFPLCCTDVLNPFVDLVTTRIGDGVISGTEFSFKNDMVKITLLYDL
jgi:hypothetical protein